MNEITAELLAEFKERMKLSDDEDKNLTSILEAAIETMVDKCGNYDVHTSERFKRLVFNCGRYEYNDAAEYFDKNFLTEINSLALSKAFKTPSVVEGDVVET